MKRAIVRLVRKRAPLLLLPLALSLALPGAYAQADTPAQGNAAPPPVDGASPVRATGTATAVEGPAPRAAAATDWAALAGRARSGEHRRVPVMVQLTPPTAEARTDEQRRRAYMGKRDALAERFSGRLPVAWRALDGAPFLALHATAADLEVLRSDPRVLSVQEDRVMTLTGTTAFGSATGQQLPSLWDIPRIGADWANNNGYTGAGMKVVIIDTGVDRSNPYLPSKVVNEACFATNANGTGACRNGGTYQYGTGFAGVTGSAAACTYTSSCAHGTHVAHTAAGTYGVARAAKVVAIQASHPEWNATLAQWEPRFSNSDLYNALWYVRTVLPRAGITAAAVNMSIGGGVGYAGYCDNPQAGITQEINALKRDLQIPTVISSGNDNYANGITWPACNSNAISVGNTTLTAASGGVDAVSGYWKHGSNTASTLDLLAPGTDICSAVPRTLDVDGTQDGWACAWNGTSMAAPHVAGALALLTQKRPAATVDQMLTALQRYGSTAGQLVTDSRNTSVSRTRINVANALYYQF